VKFFPLVLTVPLLAGSAGAQTSTRDLILKTFQSARPDAAPPDAKKRDGPRTPVKSSRAAQRQEAIVGLTLWHMRPARSSDEVKFRGFVHDADKPDDDAVWTAERASLDAPLQADEFLRLSVESARKGYLYVIDRDVYADGTMSSPSLVFPTRRLLGGDNRVTPGVPVEIPGGDDRPPVFRLKKTRADQVSVRLTVIVSTEPIPEIDSKQDARKLSSEQVAAWEKQWGSKSQQFGNPSSIGKAYTSAEQESAKPGARPLGPGDPAPALLMKSTAPPQEPIFGSVVLKVR
jgi:hypothetical protein